MVDGSVSQDVYTPAQRRARERYVDELAGHPKLYDKLAESLAPCFFGMSDEKKGVRLKLSGGSSKAGVGESEGHDGISGAARFRSAGNVVLVGDPGTFKSQLLQSAHRLAPPGVYAPGRSSFTVFLTA
jgi:DNA replicative helicase MCM subunit Mcm2 (Cdc46/Mcm family)